MNLQIFGTRKCQDTKKAQRFFKERDIACQFVELSEKPISPGELDAVIRAVGLEGLINEASKAFDERGLRYKDFDPREEVLADNRLLLTPIVRDSSRATIGYDPKTWEPG